jgi:integrase
MANLAQKNGTWLVRFRFLGKEFKRSLKSSNERDATAAQHAVEWTIHRLETGQLQLPADVEAGDFIISGGLLQQPLRIAAAVDFPSTKSLIERYLATRRQTAAPSYYESQTIHLRHFTKFLGPRAEQRCSLVNQRLLEEFLLKRLTVRNPATVKREKTTLTHFYRWVATRSDVSAFPSPVVGLPVFKSSIDRPPFRTIHEIEEIIQRGGLTDDERCHLWECLYLSPAEIAELLALVRRRSRDPLSFPLHAIPAYTGMRRGEVLRLRWADIDLQHDYVTAWSRKQSRQKTFTKRQIDLHPELKAILVDWQCQRPGGQLVISRPHDKLIVPPALANRLFWYPMGRTSWVLNRKRNWFKIGFHSYRHSFASNLAAAGIDQRIIDEFMGHQTEEMRRRYRHLFPQAKRSAIVCFSLATPTTSSAAGLPENRHAASDAPPQEHGELVS